MASERIRLRIGDMAKAVLITGQAYQDPKDPLNEFVSNAADEYAEAGRRGERIRVVLHRRGRHPVIAVEDAGRGMDAEALRRLARGLFDSPKAGDPRTLGEKAIGILAFQQLGGRCDVVTRPEGAAETLVLRLARGQAAARLETAERRRARQARGTTVYVSDLDPDVLRVLTLRKVVDYLRRRRGPALARGDYTMCRRQPYFRPIVPAASTEKSGERPRPGAGAPEGSDSALSLSFGGLAGKRAPVAARAGAAHTCGGP